MRSHHLGLIVLVALFGGDAFGQGVAGVPNPDYGTAAEREKNYDPEHAVIDLTFDMDEGSISGTVTHRVSVFGENIGQLTFDAGEMDIHSVIVQGKEASFHHADGKIRIDLDRTYRDGEKVEIRIQYSASPRVGMYWVRPEEGYPDKPYQCWTQGQAEDNHHWVPIYDRPNDRLSWETHLTVPEDLTAVSNGDLQSVEAGPPGMRTFHHVMSEPNSSYLLALAIGPWERYEDSFKNIPVEYFVSRGVGEETARRSFGMTPDILDFFSEHTGVIYPWSKYAQVAVSEFVVGGMENVTCTLQTDRTLHDSTAALERSSQGLVAHEAAHQWFGDLVTCRTWSDLWLNEGFATYWETLYREHSEGVDEFRLSMRDRQHSFMRSDGRGEPRPMVIEFFSRGESGGKSNHVYSKGASVLHMLRFVLGDQGFRKSVNHYLEKHRLGLVETRDLQIAVADATGRNLEWFFEQWVYLAGVPSFEVAFEYDEENGVGTLQVKQTQETGGLVPVFRTPVDVEIVVNGTPELHRIFVSEADQSFEFPLAAAPTRVRFDKGGWITKKLQFPRPLEELISTAEEDDDVIGRIEAVIALNEVDDEQATEALARVLQSTDHEDVRSEALSGLTKERGDVARTALLSALDDESPLIRRRAVTALGAFEGDGEIMERLKVVLAGDEAYGPRAAALDSMARIGSEEAFALAEVMLETPSHQDQIAKAALAAMVKADEERSVPFVLEASSYGTSIDLRHDAFRRLRTVARAMDETQRAEAVEVVRQGLNDLYSGTRRRAISTLEGLQAKEALADLDRLAKEDPNSRVRSSAERAAERIREGRTGRGSRRGRGRNGGGEGGDT